MSSLRVHLEMRAADLSDCATLEVDQRANGSVYIRLRPLSPRAVPVLVWLGTSAPYETGTVAYDDQASVPAELDGDIEEDVRAIDHFIDHAVEGRVTAYRKGHGGCIEERNREGAATRSWKYVLPLLPGWRRRWLRYDYEPYR